MHSAFLLILLARIIYYKIILELERFLQHLYNQFLTYDIQSPLLFNSGVFLVLFVIFYGGYIFLYPYKLVRLLYVLGFSLFFYYKSSGIYVSLLILSCLFNWLAGVLIDSFGRQKHKKIVLWTSIIGNLIGLFYFKYTLFFVNNWNWISNQSIRLEAIFLPIGISFFTFQAISYVADVYKRSIPVCNNLLDFSFYLTFFPQLVAGPIVRAKDFLPQIRQELHFDQKKLGWGLFWILKGLFKKAVIADYLAQYVDLIHANPSGYEGFEHLLAMYGYTFQIYCDFSGYSDMAIGLAMLMGFELCINFDRPYLATSSTDFWRRWHISLSTWLRDYVYIPLGGNRHGIWRMYFALLMTMLIGGFWHGADWKFVFWGAMHGVGLVIHKLYTSTLNPKQTHVTWLNYLQDFASWILTFHFVALLWIFFRASSFEAAWLSIHKIVTATDWAYLTPFWQTRPLFVLILAFAFVLHFTSKLNYESLGNYFASLPAWAKALVFLVVIQLILQFQSEGVQPFIYFQF